MDITTRIIEVKTFSKGKRGIQSIDEVWYNENKELNKSFVDENSLMFDKLGKGDKIEMVADFELRKYNKFTISTKSEKKSGWADDMTTMKDLLDAAHKKLKKFSIKSEKIEIDHKEKYALFKATLTCNIGTFEAHGDVTKSNIDSDKVQKHWIRMAESRSYVRVLRLATNDARCALEETEQGEDSLEKDNKINK